MLAASRSRLRESASRRTGFVQEPAKSCVGFSQDPDCDPLRPCGVISASLLLAFLCCIPSPRCLPCLQKSILCLPCHLECVSATGERQAFAARACIPAGGWRLLAILGLVLAAAAHEAGAIQHPFRFFDEQALKLCRLGAGLHPASNLGQQPLADD